MARLQTTASAITIILDSTLIRSCEEGERPLQVRVGNVETETDGRPVFSAVAKAETDIKMLIRCSLDAGGRTEDTVLTVFTDGCSGLRRILANVGIAARPILDWFHIAMRLQHLKQIASGLSADDPAQVAANAVIVEAVERCTGGCGMAKPRMPRSASIAFARRCLGLRANKVSARPVRPQKSYGLPCMRWMAISLAKATGWSIMPNGIVLDCGLARRLPKGRQISW